MNFDEVREIFSINQIEYNFLRRLMPLCGKIEPCHLDRILCMIKDPGSFALVESLIEGYENKE